MFKIILGFLPWILYFILVGSTRQQHEIAIIITLIATAVLDFKELKKGFILTWGTLIFFSGLLISILFFPSEWLEGHAFTLANAGLASIALISLAIKKPFTLQYAREKVPQEFWHSPIFIQVNFIITLVWTLSFIICFILNLLESKNILQNTWLFQVMTYFPSVIAIYFTKVFPDWYKTFYINRAINRSVLSLHGNPYLKDNYAPVPDELDIDHLEIEGTIPEDLNGTYMRNGPNPQFSPFSYSYPFDGDGMIHAIYIQNEKASYKNRFVVTNQLEVERRLGRSIYGGVELPFIRDRKLLKPGDPEMPVKLGRFIHIIRHANQYIALHETTSAYQLDSELNTLGEWNPNPEKNAIEVNAHTRLDPETGDLFFISYHAEPIITYHILDKSGLITHSGSLDVPHSCMVHDFVLTKNYIVIFLCPVTIDLIARGNNKHFANWEPELGTQIALISRNTFQTTWVKTESFFTYHFANAYEENEKIIVDHIRYPNFNMAINNLSPSHLYRTTIETSTKQCVHKEINNTYSEFPRINDQYNSKFYRYVYTAGKKNFSALIKHDVQTGNVVIHDFGDNHEVGEAVFVAKEKSQREDDGYLMAFVYNKNSKQSTFVILDANDISTNPLAIIKLPRRIPYGLHGSWMPT